MNRTYGTLLRHLIELFDGSVSAAYIEAGLNYRPRYTPVVRALIANEPLTINEIVEAAKITQSAVTQTVTLMIKEGILCASNEGRDGRQKHIRFTEKGRSMLPAVLQCWEVTAAAAVKLEAELPFSLIDALETTISALEKKSFLTRIKEARMQLDNNKNEKRGL